MNNSPTEIAFIPGTRMKDVRRMKQGLSDEVSIRDASAPKEILREEEEARGR